MYRFCSILLLTGLAMAQTPAPRAGSGRAARPVPPTRDPHTPGYVQATELPDGAVPSPKADGNFIIGPSHPAAAEFTPGADVPRGQIFEFTMESKDSKIYPGIYREPGTFGTPDPNNIYKLDVPTSHSGPWTRRIRVYVPKQYVAGSVTPFIVTADGDASLFPAVASVAIVKTSNRLRQPIQLSSQSVGVVAVTAPSEPNMIMPPLTKATRFLGNQTTIALSPAINEAATPSPIMARPTSSSTKLSALPNSVAPPTAITSKTLWTRRGPYRSRRTPIGIWAPAKTRK